MLLLSPPEIFTTSTELVDAAEGVHVHAVLAVHDDAGRARHLHGAHLRVGGTHQGVHAERASRGEEPVLFDAGEALVTRGSIFDRRLRLAEPAGVRIHDRQLAGLPHGVIHGLMSALVDPEAARSVIRALEHRPAFVRPERGVQVGHLRLRREDSTAAS